MPTKITILDMCAALDILLKLPPTERRDNVIEKIDNTICQYFENMTTTAIDDTLQGQINTMLEKYIKDKFP